MTLITILLVFLLGFYFSAWGEPLLDNLFNTISTWFQQVQSNMAIKITENQVKVTKMTEDINTKSRTSAVGFTIPQEEEECEDD